MSLPLSELAARFRRQMPIANKWAYFDHAAVVRVCNESVAGGQAARECDAARRPARCVGGHDDMAPRDLDRAIVVLIGDQYMPIRQQLGTVW